MNGSAEPEHGSRAASISAPGSPSPSHQLPPKRTKVSCFPCRTRKSKCDHARPCSSCVLRGTANQCADPNGSASAASAASGSASGSASAGAQQHGSGTVTPITLAGHSRSLPASMSMPTLVDTALDVERANGSHQSKRRRTEAPSSSSSRSHDSIHTADNRTSLAAPDLEISEEMQRMKQALARLEDLINRRPLVITSSSSSSSAQAASPSGVSSTHDYHLDPSQDLPGETDPPSRESRARWHQLRSVLPPLIDTHLMMHYLFVEADWLTTCIEAPRFVARWRYAYNHQSITQVFAVQFLTVVACSALFLSDNRKRTIHFAVPIRSLHTKLIKEAIRMVESMPALRAGRTEAETCDMIEIMLNISFYFRCLGKEALMARYTERAISCSLRAEFDNELRPSWFGLTEHQVERRRLLMMEVTMSTKWLAFHCRKEKAHVRVMSFNLGQAHMHNVGQLPPLSAWPQSDDVARIVAAQSQNHITDGPGGTGRFFSWRNKCETERSIVRTYHRVSCTISNELPSVVELASKTEAKLLNPEALAKVTKEEMREMARQTRQILARLEEWHTTILPRNGVGFDKVVNANITSANPVEGKAMAIVLMLNHANFYMTSILCRAWLLLSDRLQSLNDAAREEAEYEQPTMVNQSFLAHLKQRSIDHVQHVHASWLPSTFLADMEAVVLENVQRCIRSIPVIRTLQSQSSSQFYVGWTCQACLQAAVNLAIPLIRSHHRQSHGFDSSEIIFASASTDSLRRYIVTIFEAVSELSDNIAARRTAKMFNKAMRMSGIDTTPTAWSAVGGVVEEEDEGVEDAWESEESQTQQAQGGAGQMQNAAEGLALLSAASASASASSGRSPSDPNPRGYGGGASSTGSNSSPAGSGGMMGWDANAARASNDSASALNAHSHLVPFSGEPYPSSAAVGDEGLMREPMWWEARLPTPSQQMQAGNVGGSGNLAVDAMNAGNNTAAAAGTAAGTGAGMTQVQQLPMSDSQLLDELLNFDPSFWQFVLDGTNNTAAASA